jgi:Na+/melibiose symporter-like transporter
MTGFDAKLEGAQPAEVLLRMRLGYIAIPVTALAFALVLLKFFPLNHEDVNNIRGQLEARRGKV